MPPKRQAPGDKAKAPAAKRAKKATAKPSKEKAVKKGSKKAESKGGAGDVCTKEEREIFLNLQSVSAPLLVFIQFAHI